MKSLLSKVNQAKHRKKRLLFIAVALVALLAIFVFQQFSYSSFILNNLLDVQISTSWEFSLNKFARFLLNDLAVILLIHGIFYEKKYIVLAMYVLCFGFLFILLPYLFLVNKYPEYNGPLYSHLHRLIMNPILLLFLIPVLLYQKKTQPTNYSN